MIVCKPTWTRRPKAYGAVWWHEWHSTPWCPGSRVCTARVGNSSYQPGRYNASVYAHGERIAEGHFDSLDAAQAWGDSVCAERMCASLNEAVRNWKTWTKEKRKAAKAERERLAAEREARMTPEARERSRQLVEDLTRAFPDRKRSGGRRGS